MTTMPISRDDLSLCVLVDGRYFRNVSRYYRFHHLVQTYISMEGMLRFGKAECCASMGLADGGRATVDAHYFEGRWDPWQFQERYPDPASRLRKLEEERSFEMYLRRCGVNTHFQPVPSVSEKGVDVQLALTALELVRDCNVVVLVTGDGDFVPLVQNLRRLGKRVVLLCWDYSYKFQEKDFCTRTSTALIDSVNWPIHMCPLIDSRLRTGDPSVMQLFDCRTRVAQTRPAA